jgi:hypothetical protein
MLATPDTSLGPAGRPTPRRIELLTDWLELSALLEGVEIYKENVADILVECYFAVDQDDSHSIVAEIWRTLRRRERNVGAQYPFELTQDYIAGTPGADVVYRFMLILSAPEYLSGYSIDPSDSIRNTFELVTVEGIAKMLPGWEVKWCGATSEEMRSAGGVISFVAGLLSTQVRDETYFTTHQDGGLDFIAIWKADDTRAAKPALWGQCATGLNWLSKVTEPNFNLWKDAIRLVPDPVRTLAIPFSLDRTTFTNQSVAGRGWIVDRERLARFVDTIESAEVATEIQQWVDAQYKALPRQL